MDRRDELQFRLMTYNIGGGRKDDDSTLDRIIEVVEEASPDILAIQEAVEWQDADGVWHSTASKIAEALGVEENFCFGPTLSMREHMHVKKASFVEAIFKDWQDWSQGNAILSRYGFVRLGDPSRQGKARNVPLYRAPLYEGNRDTDPRHALLARVNAPPAFPFVAGLHLTTLLGERSSQPLKDLTPREAAKLRAATEEATVLRYRQAKRLIDLLRHHVLDSKEVIFLLSDVNAVASEPCISTVLEAEGEFVRLIPSNEIATHPKADKPIDHIFVYPRNRIIDYSCWVVESDTPQQPSDHLPVVADVKIRCL